MADMKEDTKRLINTGAGKLQYKGMVGGKPTVVSIAPGASFVVPVSLAAKLMVYSHVKDAATVVPELNDIDDLKKKVAALSAENAALKSAAAKTAPASLLQKPA